MQTQRLVMVVVVVVERQTGVRLCGRVTAEVAWVGVLQRLLPCAAWECPGVR